MVKSADIRKGYTKSPNEVLSSVHISLAAKGLYCLIKSKAENYKISAQRLSFEDTKEERKTILRLMKELEKNDLLFRKKKANGTMDYFLSNCDEPKSVSGTLPKSQNGTLLNIEYKTNYSKGVFLEEKKKPKETLESVKAAFEKCRLLWPAKRRGLETEWENFIKKYGKEEDKMELCREIYRGIRKEKKLKADLRNNEKFVPEWPMFVTYINQRRWEEHGE